MTRESDNQISIAIERLSTALTENERLKVHADSMIAAMRADNERLMAQVVRDEEHYQSAMAMAEKHRRNWVEACKEREQLRTELATVIERTGYHLLRARAMEPKP